MSPIQNVTIIVAVAVGSCIRGGKESGVKPPSAFAQLRRGRHSRSERLCETSRRSDRKHSCELVSIRGYIGSR